MIAAKNTGKKKLNIINVEVVKGSAAPPNLPANSLQFIKNVKTINIFIREGNNYES